ncbi:MAG: MerR family transcriptional regulator [Chloroflexota bacterium]
MNTKEVADRLGRSTATMRLWTTQEYKAYFSDGAQGDGTRRVWNDRDLQIATLIHELKVEGMQTDSILATLNAVRDNDWQGLPESPDALPSLAAVKQVADTRLDEREKALRMQISTLSVEVDNLRTELKDTRAENTQLRDRLTERERELGRAQGQLEELRKQDTRQTRLWLAVIVGALVAAGGLGALIAFLLSG